MRTHLVSFLALSACLSACSLAGHGQFTVTDPHPDQLDTVGSFVELVNRDKGGESVIFASKGKLVAVLNFHGALPGFCDGRIVYRGRRFDHQGVCGSAQDPACWPR